MRKVPQTPQAFAVILIHKKTQSSLTCGSTRVSERPQYNNDLWYQKVTPVLMKEQTLGAK